MFYLIIWQDPEMQFLSLMGCINGTSFEKKISFRKWKNVMLAAAYTLCKNKGYIFTNDQITRLYCFVPLAWFVNWICKYNVQCNNLCVYLILKWELLIQKTISYLPELNRSSSFKSFFRNGHLISNKELSQSFIWHHQVKH